MCRSALEYPPNGKRCGFGTHMTTKEREQRRLQRNAREKELYHIRKQLANSCPVGSKFVEAFNQLQISVAGTEKELEERFIPVWDREDTSTASEDDLVNIKRILSEPQPDLAYLTVVSKDSDFDADCTNDVSLLTLEDGSRGYFKDYDHMKDQGDGDSILWFGPTILGSFTNEVAAYQLSEALGEPYKGMVPVTVFREHDNHLGTLQLEAEGTVGAGWDMDNEDWDADAVRRAALFDYIAGSQDRHSDNYAVVKNADGKGKPIMIDNGFSFPKDESPLNTSVFLEMYIADGSKTLTAEDKETLKKAIVAAKDGGVLDKYLAKSARETLITRCSKLLDDGELTENNWLGTLEFPI